jgi:YidC/Oxa1 family membrane protein insertase
MNKDSGRLISFVIASGVILFGFNYFFNPKPKAAAEKPSVSSPAAVSATAGQAQPASQAATAVPKKELKTSLKAPAGKSYTFQTPLYTVDFSDAGAVIREIKLNKYTDTDVNLREMPVELAPTKALNTYMSLRSSSAVLENAKWEYKGSVKSGATTAVSFSRAAGNGLVVTKEFVLDDSTYLIKINIKIKNNSSAAATLKDLVLEWGPNLHYLPSDLAKHSGMGYAYNRVVYGGDKQKTTVINVNLKAKEDKTTIISAVPDWIAIKDLYFMSSFIFEDKTKIRGARMREETGGFAYIAVDFSDTIVNPGKEELFSVSTYTGPQEYKKLAKIGMQSSIDLGWNWIRPISIGMFYLMDFLYSISKNWGLAIILITVIVRGLLWLPSQKSYKHMKDTQKKMAVIQPRLETLKKIYKDDSQKMNEEMMKLYKEYNINPLGGCLPMLLQLPIFFALYATLMNMVELKGATFIFWLTDLSKPDKFYVLPILMGGTMFLQQKMTTTVQTTPEAAQQQKILMYAMPIMLTWMSFQWPSGLLLYWSVSNVLSILQQLFVNKSKD